MTNLTPAQEAFIKKYVWTGLSSEAALVLDPVIAPESTPEGREADAKMVLGELIRLAPPPGIDATASGNIVAQIKEIRELIQPPVTQTELRSAAGKLKTLIEAHAAALDPLRKELIDAADNAIAAVPKDARSEDRSAVVLQAGVVKGIPDPADRESLAAAGVARATLNDLVEKAVTNAEQDRTARALKRKSILESATKLAETLDRSEAEPDEATAVDTALDDVGKALPEPPSPDHITAGELALETLREKLKQAEAGIETRKEARNLRRTELLKEADDAVSGVAQAELEGGEAAEITTAREAVTKALPEEPSASDIKTGIETVGTLTALTKRLSELIVTRNAERRAEITRLGTEAAAKLSTDAGTADGNAVAVALKLVTDALPATALKSDLEKARGLLTPLGEVVEARNALVVRRKAVREKAAPLLERLKWGEGALAPHDKAPEPETTPIKLEAEGLKTDHTNLGDLAKLKELEGSELEVAERKAEELMGKIETVEGKLKLLNETIAAAVKILTEAVAAARTAVGDTSPIGLTDAQQKPLLERVATAETEGEASLADLTETKSKLAAVTKEAAALRRAIKPLKSRFDRVGPLAGTALKAETDQLAKLKLAAEAALQGALEP